MSRPAYKFFYIFSKDGKELINTAVGFKELARLMKREIEQVQNSYYLIKSKRTKHIRDNDGNAYTLYDEEMFFGKGNIRK